MRILHLASEYPPLPVFGLGRYVAELASHQAADGHEVCVITNDLGGRDEERNIDGVRVLRVFHPPPPKAPERSAMLLHFNMQLVERAIGLKLRDDLDCDVVVAHDWLTFPACFHLSRLLSVPLVTIIHDVIFNKVRTRKLLPPDEHIAGIENWACAVSTKVICLSDTVRQELVSAYHAPVERIEVVPGGVSILPVSEDEIEAVQGTRRRHSSDDCDLILYAGRLDAEKGVGVLLDALKRLKETRGSWKAVLAGSGQLEDHVKRAVKDLNLRSHVEMLGYLPFKDLRLLYAAADLVVVPSDYEPFGLVALEAQRMGTPVIVSETGGLSETLQITKGGLSFPSRDIEKLHSIMVELLEDAELRSELGIQGQVGVGEHYSWPAISKRISAVLSSVSGREPARNIAVREWRMPAVTAETPAKSEIPINEVTIFCDTSVLNELAPILNNLLQMHSFVSLKGTINVVPTLCSKDSPQTWNEPTSHGHIRYISADATEVRQALRNSAFVIGEHRFAETLIKSGLIVPRLIPTLWIGGHNEIQVGGWSVGPGTELYVLGSKLLCDDRFRRRLAPDLFNPLPHVAWTCPNGRKPVVVHVVPQLVTGGAETTLLSIIRGTKDFQHYILSIGPIEGPLPEEFKRNGAIIVALSVQTPDVVTKWLQDVAPDLLHLHSMSYVESWIPIHRMLWKQRVIETEHVVNIGSGHFGPVDVVACVSHATLAAHERYTRSFRDCGSKFDVIYNGIDIEQYCDLPTKEIARERLGLPNNRPIVGRVSALARNKLPIEALDAVREIVKQAPDVLFVIVGDGPQRQSAEEWIRENNLTYNVQFLGERRDIPAVLRAFDVFAYYTTKDALGNVILEATAANVPVVTTDVEGTREALGDAPGQTAPLGDLKAFASAVCRWLDSSVSTTASHDYRFPSKFTRQEMCTKYGALYADVCGQRGELEPERPAVTVLMPVYNTRKEWLTQALDSVKRQTFEGWTLLIVDDCSDDSYFTWLDSYLKDDPVLKQRSKLIRSSENNGVASALNLGLRQCETELVARMDSDDRMYPDRLAAQVAEFQKNPELVVLGGRALLMDEAGKQTGGQYVYPSEHADILKMLGQSCAFAHPAVMYRRSAVLAEGGYRSECKHFEDYDLWVTLAERGHRFQNLDRPLVEYRVHDNSVSKLHTRKQADGAQACARRASELLAKSKPTRIVFTGVRYSYGDPKRGDSVEYAFFGRALQRMPDVEVHFLPADELVRKLGKERAGLELINTVESLKADVVFTVLGDPNMDFLPQHIRHLTDRGVVTINWNCDDHWRLPYTLEWAQHYSYMVTTDEASLDKWQAAGHSNKILLSQWACNEFDYFPGQKAKDIDICFVGRPYGHRADFIRALSEAGLHVDVYGAGWRDNKEIPFTEMIDILRRSKIALNFSLASQGTRNQLKARFFEIPACGTFMLTEPADGMESYLSRGKHYDIFDRPDVLINKARQWLLHPERDQLAAEASTLIRSQHTYRRRLHDIFAKIGLSDRYRTARAASAAKTSPVTRIAVHRWWKPTGTHYCRGTNTLLDFAPEAGAEYDYALDLDRPFSQVSMAFPPERRLFASTEPSRLVDYSTGLSDQIGQYYQGLILSWHEQLKHHPQTRPWHALERWVEPAPEDVRKSFGLGGVISAKRKSNMDGYALRHLVLQQQGKLTIPGIVFNYTGRWREHAFEYPIPDKTPAMQFMFHLAIENCSERGYFTEKLIDAFAARCVPLYYGDPDIASHFDVRGMFILDPEKFVEQINSLTESDYASRRPYIERNFELSKQYWSMEKQLALALQSPPRSFADRNVITKPASMDFTFGIITDGSKQAAERLSVIIESIEAEKIPRYEVVIVGNVQHAPMGDRLRAIHFNESLRRNWITRKKNMITEQARYANVVYMHDYLKLVSGWYEGWKVFGDNFTAAMNVILNADGTRYRDWTLSPDSSVAALKKAVGVDSAQNLLPYDQSDLSRAMYFSGAYWVAKRDTMRAIPLDENLVWGEGEDVEWSRRFREKHEFRMNPYSAVRVFGKMKDVIFSEFPVNRLNSFREELLRSTSPRA